MKENEAEFVQLVRKASELQSEEAAKLQKKQLAKHEKRCTELDNLIKHLYENKVKGELSAKRFDILSTEYEREQGDLEKQISELQDVLEQFNEDSDKTAKFIAIVRKYTDITELNATILNEYIDKVVVFEADKSSGRREQRVDIYLNFIGKFELPGQGADAESEPFDPAEHRKAQFRAYYHRNKEKILAGKAEKRAAKLAAEPVKTTDEIAAEQEVRKERHRAYQREYQKEWRKRRSEQNSTKSTQKAV